MAEKTFLTPEVLPVLPVRDTVLFPGAMLPLTVGRESSLALVGSLQGEEKLLGVVAQLDPRIEDPAAADLHKVGTLARVHKTVKMPNGNVVVFLEGLQRIQIVELADFIAGMLPSLSTLLRQELIETASVRKRLEILIRELSKELEVLELRSKIHEQVQEQVSQNQREYLLREQMKAIQKELGESEDTMQEIDELRKKVEEAGMTAEAKKECERELKRRSKMTPASAEYMD